MRYIDNGAFFTVQVSAQDVREFSYHWPCFGNVRPMWFQYSNSGDLVDMSDSTGMDESGILALSRDAQRWARYYLQAQCKGRKTITVDVHHVYGTRGTNCARFLYRGDRMRGDIFNPYGRDIPAALAKLDGFAHWRNAQTGAVKLIVGE